MHDAAIKQFLKIWLHATKAEETEKSMHRAFRGILGIDGRSKRDNFDIEWAETVPREITSGLDEYMFRLGADRQSSSLVSRNLPTLESLTADRDFPCQAEAFSQL